ncbi:glycosyltransferase [Microbacterium sp. SSM24]|uniref:glycosyltransferase n=1 Tax=Microbacterium sp. SSM24 TaxID=2991714 RepID=UPI00222734CD|nr:glycosyltransferase [Microbacterium sp. SSM24]MCW3493022.1 glycosyltransferase [Microbacterium sp. SSM24]
MLLPALTATPTATPSLPARRQLAVTWGIPQEYGGMTAALLHRSRTLVEVAGADVEIVTFDPAPEFSLTRARLADRGELVPGMSLRNVYEDLRTVHRPAATVAVVPAPAERPHDEELVGPDGAIRHWHRGSDLERVEHLRSDGTLALLDDRASNAPRRLTAFDEAGLPTGQWDTASALYFDWLDELIAGDAVVAIVDSKAVARLMQRYRRPRVTLVYVVHGSHLAGQDVRSLDDTRRGVFDNLHRWDAVVLQTERQRTDVIDLLGDTGNLEVVPNPLAVPAAIRRLPPDRLRGVIVSRLSALKRLDHALRVVAGVRAMGLPVTLDIIGDGRQRTRLERVAADLGISEAVRFSGYDPDGAAHFAEAAWTLLTSRSEGGSLVLLEAMAAGCLPIVYDIRYGTDVVQTRRNGWRVPDGDVEAAVRALAEACVLDDDDLAMMRRNAHRTAQARDGAAVVAQWGDVQRRAGARHEQAANGETVLHRIRVRRLGGRHVVTAIVAAPHAASASVEVRLRARDGRGAATRSRMRSVGPLRFTRLARGSSESLGDGPVRTRFAITTADDVRVVDAGVRHPDPRSLARRIADRARRLVHRA